MTGRSKIPRYSDTDLRKEGYNAGAVYLYDGSGELLQTFLPPDPVSDGHFGQNLGTFDDLIVIGSNYADGGFSGPGAVYVYAPVALLPGDFNGDSRVDQADLDFVLLNWGYKGSAPPNGWVRNLPGSLVDQQELDNVLLNWGQTTAATTNGSGVPEPTTFGLGCLAALIVSARLIILQRDRRARRCDGSR